MASTRATEELPVMARFEVRRRNYLALDGSINRSQLGVLRAPGAARDEVTL